MPNRNTRISKGIIMSDKVQAIDTGFNIVYEVPSGTSPSITYTVIEGTCTCPDYHFHCDDDPGHKCKHIIAVLLYEMMVPFDSRFCIDADREYTTWCETR